MADHWIDFVVIILYFGGITFAGFYFSKRNKSTEEYFLGNRSFPGWVIGLSMVGTSISSVSFLAYPGDAYKTAWLRLLPAFTLPLGVLAAAIFFLPFFRRGGLTSAYEYLEGRFGPGTRVYAALAFVLGQTFRIGMILYLLSLLVREFLQVVAGHDLGNGWLMASILVAGIFVSFYTIAGGIEAVIWTDVVQTIVLVIGGVICLVVIVLELPGGLGQIFDVALRDGKFQFAEMLRDGSFKPPSWNLSLTHKTATMMLIIGLTNWLTEYSSNQNVVQRYCASKSAREARKAMWICCWSSIPIWTYFMFLGTALYVFFQVFPTDRAAAILTGAGGAKAEEILPYFAFGYLPQGIAGLVVAAVLAAAMSSLDSSINAISTVSVVDIYRRHLVKGRSDQHYLRAARVIAIVAAVLMVLIAMGFAQYSGKTLQHTGTVIGALTGGGLLGLFILGFFVPWGDGRAIFWGIVTTLAFSGFMVMKKIGLITVDWPPLDEYYVGLLGNVIMFAVGFGAACFLPRRKRDLTNLTVWTQDDTPLQ